MRWESYLFFVAYVCNFIFKNSFNLKSKIYFLLKALRYYFMCCSAVQHNLVVLYWRNLCYYIFIVVFYIISWKKATQRSYVFWLLKSMVAGLEIRILGESLLHTIGSIWSASRNDEPILLSHSSLKLIFCGQSHLFMYAFNLDILNTLARYSKQEYWAQI